VCSGTSGDGHWGVGGESIEHRVHEGEGLCQLDLIECDEIENGGL
jgi:hypothetical protein